jgi:hypothetical protein
MRGPVEVAHLKDARSCSHWLKCFCRWVGLEPTTNALKGR